METQEDLMQQLRETVELCRNAADTFGEDSPYLAELIKNAQYIAKRMCASAVWPKRIAA